MKTVVQKYGGTSVANTEMLKKVAQKIVKTKESGKNVVVVVSAMGHTTDAFLSLAHQISSSPASRELDMLLSVGERISMTLLSMAINDLGYQAISFTGSQSGIITDTSHTHARIVEVRADRIKKALNEGRIVIVAGYQGVSLEKEVTTLGRGGSDTTAVALAAALDAECCEIYSDVDGIYTADPKIVPDARRLDEISYDDMLELSAAGAVVLNENAVEYARDHNIKLHAASSFSDSQGTDIKTKTKTARHKVIGIASEEKLLCYSLSDADFGKSSFLQIYNLLMKHEVCAKQIIFHRISEEFKPSLAVVCPYSDRSKAKVVCQELTELTDSKVEVSGNLGSVSIIGEGIRTTPHVGSTFFSVLDENGIKLYGLDISERRQTCLILSEKVNFVVNEMHVAYGLDEN